MEIDSAINFMINRIQLRHPWGVSQHQVNSAKTKIKTILEAETLSHGRDEIKINFKKGCREGSIGHQVNQVLSECDIDRALSPAFCMWINPGEVYFRVEKHGQKFNVFNSGEKEWRQGDPIYGRRNGGCAAWCKK